MTRNDIDQIYTAKVAELLAQGYQINTSTMGGSQGEIAHTDLRKGSEILRVLLESQSCYSEGYGDWYTITVGRNTDTLLRGEHGTLWNNRLEVLFEIKFAKISDTFFTTPEAAAAMADKRRARRKARKTKPNQLGDAYKAIALKYIKRQPRMKSCRLDDIESVLRQETLNGRMYYEIKARGNWFKLRSGKA